MRYLSVCSGIEAATVAWHPLGWEPAAFAEINPAASAVLAHHYPTVPNLGDITRYARSTRWTDLAFDLLVGGTPCQSFSIAGLRNGLRDPRGDLTLTYLAIAAKYRPRWLVWENVPGILSHDDGRTFGAVLRGLAQCGYGFAYRVLDAQFIRVESHPRAVPQRRPRVFVVGHFADWRRACAVLLERESMRRHHAPRNPARQGIPPAPHGAFTGDSDYPLIPAVANPLTARMVKGINTTGDEGQTMIGDGRGLRILTPRECERAQGFPDDYTAVPYKGDTMPDRARYVMLGNSMAVNVMRWIGERIAMVDRIDASTPLPIEEPRPAFACPTPPEPVEQFGLALE